MKGGEAEEVALTPSGNGTRSVGPDSSAVTNTGVSRVKLNSRRQKNHRHKHTHTTRGIMRVCVCECWSETHHTQHNSSACWFAG